MQITAQPGAQNFPGWPRKKTSSLELFSIAWNFLKYFGKFSLFHGCFTNIFVKKVHILTEAGFYNVKLSKFEIDFQYQ